MPHQAAAETPTAAAAVSTSAPVSAEPSEADLSGISSRERFRGLLWLVAAAFFMQALDSTVVNTAVPAMAEALGVTPLGMRTALTSYVLTLAILIPASPWLCDRLGTRRVFGIAIMVFGVGSLACGLAQTLPQLVAARVLQGIGGASLMPVGRYVLVRSIDKHEFVRAMSTVATSGRSSAAWPSPARGFRRSAERSAPASPGRRWSAPYQWLLRLPRWRCWAYSQAAARYSSGSALEATAQFPG